MSRPSNVTVPPSEAIRPQRRLNTVVLPAPFGPMRECTVLRLTRRSHIVDRDETAESLRERARFQDGLGHGADPDGGVRAPSMSRGPGRAAAPFALTSALRSDSGSGTRQAPIRCRSPIMPSGYSRMTPRKTNRR